MPSTPPPGDVADALARGDTAPLGSWLDRDGARLPAPDRAYYRALALALGGQVAPALEIAREALRLAIGDDQALELVAQLERLATAAPVEPAPGSGWAVGRVVHDRWEVFGAARGGMGQVYFVRDRAWGGKQLAVKSLLVSTGGDDTGARIELFRREARVWLDLGGHPNIVSGYYTLELDAALRFFMEYVPGRALAALVDGGALAWPRGLDLAIQLAAAMAYVHGRGVVHRDLKPDNCLVGDGDALRVTDFGLGKQRGDTDGGAATPSALSALSLGGAGTPAYMAPEQWRALGAAGAPTDVYAFGVVLYELFAGRRPFVPGDWRGYDRVPGAIRAIAEAQPASALRMLHETVAPASMRALGADAPVEVETLAARCLAKRADDRPPFEQVRDELLAIHARLAGPYRRELHAGFRSTPGGDNNRAVSYHVMGDVAAARALLDELVVREPDALLPKINRIAIDLAAGAVLPAAVAGELQPLLDRASPDGPAPTRTDAIARLRTDLARHALPFRGDATALATSPDGTRAIAGSVQGDAVVLEVATGEVLARHRFDKEISEALFDDRGRPMVGVGLARLVRLDPDGPVELPSPGNLLSLTRSGPTLMAATDAGVWTRDGDGPWAAWTAIALPDGASPRTVSGHIVVDHGEVVTVYDLAGRRIHRHALGERHTWIAAVFASSAMADHRATEVTALAIGERRIALALRIRSTGQPTRGLVSICELGGAAAATMPAEDPVMSLAFADRLVLAGDSRGRVLVLDPDREVVRAEYAGHDAPIPAIAVARGVVLSAGWDGTVRRWPLSGRWPGREAWPLAIAQTLSAHERESLDVRVARLVAQLGGESGAAAGAELDELRHQHAEYERDPALIAAIAGAVAGRARRAGLRGSWLGAAVTLDEELHACACSGETLVVGGRTGAVRALSLDALDRPPRLLRDKLPGLRALAWCGRDVVAAGDRTAVALGPHGELRVHWGGIFCKPTLVVAAGGEDILLLEEGGRIGRWRGKDRRAQVRVRGEVLALAALTSGGAVAGRADGAVVWADLDGGRVAEVTAHRDRVTAVAASAKHVASGGYDRGIALWDPAQRTVVGVLQAHRGWIAALAFSPDGAWLASAGGDRVVRVWDVARREQLAELSGAERTIRGLAFARDGLALVAVDEAGGVRLWHLDPAWAFYGAAASSAARISVALA